MRPKLAMILALLVILPTALLMGLGVRLARHEQERTQQRFENLLRDRLGDVDAGIARLLAVRETELRRGLTLSEFSPSSLRAVARSSPLLLQAFALDPAGLLIYPSPEGNLSAGEWSFLERARDVLERKDLLQQAAAGDGQGGRASGGWYSWYWGRDIRLLYWIRDGRDRIVGAELGVVRLLADLIAELPDTPQDAAAGEFDGRIRLVDSRGEVLYQWGTFEAPEGSPPAVRRSLGAPLDAWSLEYFLPAELLSSRGNGTLATLLLGTLILGLLLTGGAVYFYRESSRDLREAAQRVTFVNQVSHELKTPLTNIRMYAELLAEQTDPAEERTRRHADVIVTESRRLSRLIGNILSFSRKQRKTLTLRPAPGIVDETVATVLDHYRPGLEAVGVAITSDGGATSRVSFDADALEQILGNLLSNVEKYGASGGTVTIASREAKGHTVLTVSDGGPGIPASAAGRVFERFFRVSNRLTDGVSGTGIGLSIARDLARLHGGDLELIPSEAGATFRLTLATPPPDTPPFDKKETE